MSSQRVGYSLINENKLCFHQYYQACPWSITLPITPWLLSTSTLSFFFLQEKGMEVFSLSYNTSRFGSRFLLEIKPNQVVLVNDHLVFFLFLGVCTS
jgi:hypothetical protein